MVFQAEQPERARQCFADGSGRTTEATGDLVVGEILVEAQRNQQTVSLRQPGQGKMDALGFLLLHGLSRGRWRERRQDSLDVGARAFLVKPYLAIDLPFLVDAIGAH